MNKCFVILAGMLIAPCFVCGSSDVLASGGGNGKQMRNHGKNCPNGQNCQNNGQGNGQKLQDGNGPHGNGQKNGNGKGRGNK